MNKLSKIGLSALCGSLATFSGAHAGELNVKGGITISHTQNDGETTGNPLGMNSGMTFTGSGEFDNGSTFTYTLTQADQTAYSAGSVVLNTILGDFTLSHGNGGTGIDAYDDKVPTAWEETWGTGISPGFHMINGVGTSTNIQYKTPALPVLGLQVAVAYAGKVDAAQINDKANSPAGSDALMDGMDVVVTLNPSWGDWNSGLNVFAGAHRTQGGRVSQEIDGHNDDAGEAVAGATFALGPVTIGGQRSAEFLRGAKTTASSKDFYTTKNYGIAFNVNDDLSLSWGEMISKVYFVDPGSNPAIETSAESWQIAYTMGGVSIKVADTSVDNAAYTSGTSADKDGRTVALTFAF